MEWIIKIDKYIKGLLGNNIMVGYIYKIKCLETNKFYIGSTLEELYKRIAYHKDIKNNRCASYEIIKNNNYEFIILDTIDTNNKKSIQLIENLYILIGRKTNRCINKNIAISTNNIHRYREKLWRNNNK